MKNKILTAMLILAATFLLYSIITKYQTASATESSPEIPAEIITIEDKKTAEVERDVAAEILKQQIIIADTVITEIRNTPEIIVYEEIGTLSFAYTKDSDEWYKWFTHNDIEIDLEYSAIVVMSTDKIKMTNNSGVVEIEYSVDNFYCKSIEFSNPLATTDSGWFAQEYTENEVLTMVDIQKEQLRNSITLNIPNTEAEETLVKYLSDLCGKLGSEFGINTNEYGKLNAL